MYYYYSIACIFISWLTAHSLINYFTLNARVSGVRMFNFCLKLFKLIKQLMDFTCFIFSSFGQMIRPLIDSLSVRPAVGPAASATSSLMSSTSSKGKESVFEPREVLSGATMPREKENIWLVLLSLVVSTQLSNLL